MNRARKPGCENNKKDKKLKKRDRTIGGEKKRRSI